MSKLSDYRQAREPASKRSKSWVPKDVDTSDPNGIWIDGADDTNHPVPLAVGLFLLFLPPAIAFALVSELTEYSRTRKLLAPGKHWRQVEVTVTRKTAGRNGATILFEANDPQE